MNLKSFRTRNYDDFAALRLEKNKANLKPIKAKFRNDQMTAPDADLTEYDLKKESQSAGRQMNVSILLTMDYENTGDWAPGENKPNQSQFQKHPFGAEGQDV
jgi:hypothetical protein